MHRAAPQRIHTLPKTAYRLEFHAPTQTLFAWTCDHTLLGIDWEHWEVLWESPVAVGTNLHFLEYPLHDSEITFLATTDNEWFYGTVSNRGIFQQTDLPASLSQAHTTFAGFKLSTIAQVEPEQFWLCGELKNKGHLISVGTSQVEKYPIPYAYVVTSCLPLDATTIALSGLKRGNGFFQIRDIASGEILVKNEPDAFGSYGVYRYEDHLYITTIFGCLAFSLASHQYVTLLERPLETGLRGGFYPGVLVGSQLVLPTTTRSEVCVFDLSQTDS